MSQTVGRASTARRWPPGSAVRLSLAAGGLIACGLLPAGRPVRAAGPPGNGKVAFVSTRDNDPGEIYIGTPQLDPNKGPIGLLNQTRLTVSPGADFEPRFSPDGTRIVFTSERSGNDNVFVMNADGSGQTQLTTMGANLQPNWSPDGSKIIFTSYRTGHAEVWVMNADGSSQTQLTNGPAASPELNYQPAWSPIGTQIAFVSYRTGHPEIYVMNPDGSGVTNITNSPYPSFTPEWSPDGTNIVFGRDTGLIRRDINRFRQVFMMTSHGDLQRNLSDERGNDLYPTFSPDGTKIIFSSERVFLGEPSVLIPAGLANGQVFVMNLDGTGLTPLTGFNAVEVNSLNISPTWQPAL